LEAARKAVKSLKEKGTDIIIAMTHQSITADIDLAVQIPEIDLIMGGHEHENISILRGDNFTPITKADANAKTAFIHQLTFNKDTKSLTIESELMFIDGTIKSDPAIEKRVQYWTDIAFKSFEEQGYQPRETVCVSDKILDGSEAAVRNRSTGLTDLITRGFLTAYPNADASLMNGGSIRIDDKLQPGPITQYDILKISPFGGDISLVSMKGSTLIKALDQGVLNAGTGAFVQYGNIDHSDDQWEVKNEPIQPTKDYLIAISTYMVEKGDSNLGFLTYKEGEVQKTDFKKHEFFKVVIDQFRIEFPK
jgi:5'-nucleotidase / UDP-sugar diphosphatase